jgi:hypothetical protein
VRGSEITTFFDIGYKLYSSIGIYESSEKRTYADTQERKNVALLCFSIRYKKWYLEGVFSDSMELKTIICPDVGKPNLIFSIPFPYPHVWRLLSPRSRPLFFLRFTTQNHY